MRPDNYTLGLSDAMSGAAVLTADETCEILKIGRTTLWHYTRTGEIRPMRVGKARRGIRFSSEEIRRHRRRKTPGSHLE